MISIWQGLDCGKRHKIPVLRELKVDSEKDTRSSFASLSPQVRQVFQVVETILWTLTLGENHNENDWKSLPCHHDIGWYVTSFPSMSQSPIPMGIGLPQTAIQISSCRHSLHSIGLEFHKCPIKHIFNYSGVSYASRRVCASSHVLYPGQEPPAEILRLAAQGWKKASRRAFQMHARNILGLGAEQV